MDIIDEIYTAINGKERGSYLRMSHIEQLRRLEAGETDYIILNIH